MRQMNIDIFWNHTLLELIDYITRRYYLTKGIIDNYKVVINGKIFYDQPN